MTAIGGAIGSLNYDKRKIMAKGLANKYNVPIVYVKNRKIYVPDYVIENNQFKIIMWTKFYKKDLRLRQWTTF